MMSGGNNVKRCDTSCKSAIKNAFIIIIIIVWHFSRASVKNACGGRG